MSEVAVPRELLGTEICHVPQALMWSEAGVRFKSLSPAGWVTLVKSPDPTNLDFPLYITKVKGLNFGPRRGLREMIDTLPLGLLKGKGPYGQPMVGASNLSIRLVEWLTW